MTTRAHFDWCPHGTGNVTGCGVCVSYRSMLDERERAGRLKALRWARGNLLANGRRWEVDFPDAARGAAECVLDIDAEIARIEAEGDTHRSPDPRPHHLVWSGTEWVDGRCGCRYHPDDDNGSQGGAPHVHRCEAHAEGKRSERLEALRWAREQARHAPLGRDAAYLIEAEIARLEAEGDTNR